MSTERVVFRDVCKFYEKYAGKEQTDEYWKNLAKEMGQLSRFYKENSLCQYLILAVFHHLENMQYYNQM